MIKINVSTTTKGGLPVQADIVLNVNPEFNTLVVKDELGAVTGERHDVTFNTRAYSSLASYEAGDEVITREQLQEFEMGHTVYGVSLATLTSPTALLDIYKNHIENGDGNAYSGVGAGNTEIVFSSLTQL